MNRPDYIHMQNIIIGAITAICRDDNANREVEMSEMIRFMTEMHATAVMTLAAAVLVSAKQRLEREPDYDVAPMMEAVRNLIEATDADFSVKIRAKIMNIVTSQETPNPFEGAAGSKL